MKHQCYALKAFWKTETEFTLWNQIPFTFWQIYEYLEASS